MNVRAMLDAGFANAELASALDTESNRVYGGAAELSAAAKAKISTDAASCVERYRAAISSFCRAIPYLEAQNFDDGAKTGNLVRSEVARLMERLKCAEDLSKKVAEKRAATENKSALNLESMQRELLLDGIVTPENVNRRTS